MLVLVGCGVAKGSSRIPQCPLVSSRDGVKAVKRKETA